MSQSPVPPGAPTTQSQSTTREVIVAVQDLVLEAALEAGVTPIQTQEAGSPSRSLPHPIARQQVASLRSREPVLLGVGGGGWGGEHNRQRPSRFSTGRPGRNSTTRLLHSGRKGVVDKFRMETLASILLDLQQVDLFKIWIMPIFTSQYIHHTGSIWGLHWRINKGSSAFTSGESFRLGWQQHPGYSPSF